MLQSNMQAIQEVVDTNLDGIKNINVCNESTGAKAKRKSRSTRRRLNALMNNTSLHFSDTDSEGELAVTRIITPNHNIKIQPPVSNNNLLNPIISVTLDGSDDSSYGNGHRGSFVENLTDVDEIYTSEPENDLDVHSKSRLVSSRKGLTIIENPLQGETDLEDVSNDEEEVVQTPIYVKARGDILCDFNGEMITTKEGDGPFSVEVRNQMSIDETHAVVVAPDIVLMPVTDSEDMEASDEEEEEGACGHREQYEDLDVIAASQIVMRNVDKMDQLLSVKDLEDGVISDSHTDVEDLE